jgi:hypothetical protein
MITLQTIKDLSEKMKAAPRVENLKRKVENGEALQKLVPSMKTMQGNGYDLEQIAAVLNDAGLRVSVRALARILKPQPKP